MNDQTWRFYLDLPDTSPGWVWAEATMTKKQERPALISGGSLFVAHRQGSRKASGIALLHVLALLHEAARKDIRLHGQLLDMMASLERLSARTEAS
jgi:hypothetical protein